MKLIQSMSLSFTIWVLTALMNAVLSGTVVSVFSVEFDFWPSTMLLVFIFTLIFSIPGTLLFWIILLVNWKKAGLFRILLKAGVIVSLLSSLIIYTLPVGLDKGQQLLLSLCTVISTVTAVMLHHSLLLSITKKNKIENYV